MHAVEESPPTGVRRMLHSARRPLRSARRIETRARWALEDRRLAREQRRVELGRAHRRWRGNSASENRARWDGWDWSAAGEEWTASPEWKQALIEDVLVRWIPRDSVVLEIGPGAGRWTEQLLALASRLVVVDVSDRPLELCRRRFAGASNVEYLRCGGSDLAPVADASIEAVWSFDVLVHVAPTDQASYLGEIARVLAPGGIAVLHHADGRNRGLLPSRQGWRAPMSRELFAALARERGLQVECQFDSWGPAGCYDLGAFADAITVCRR
jgi:SAM-dependent methyltransferase